jgi:hypothetical protein
VKQRGGPQQGLEAEKRQRYEARLARLEEAFGVLESTLEEVVGIGSREMSIATTHLQTAWLWAREALEE